MSDPVTNVEIEDVLSSIRRLISEDDRPPPIRRSDFARQDERITGGGSRLLLTEALRVARDDNDVLDDSEESALGEEHEVDRAVPEDAEAGAAVVEETPAEHGLVTEDAVAFAEDAVAVPPADTRAARRLIPAAGEGMPFAARAGSAPESAEPQERPVAPKRMVERARASERAQMFEIPPEEEFEPEGVDVDDFGEALEPMAWEDNGVEAAEAHISDTSEGLSDRIGRGKTIADAEPTVTPSARDAAPSRPANEANADVVTVSRMSDRVDFPSGVAIALPSREISAAPTEAPRRQAEEGKASSDVSDADPVKAEENAMSAAASGDVANVGEAKSEPDAPAMFLHRPVARAPEPARESDIAAPTEETSPEAEPRAGEAEPEGEFVADEEMLRELVTQIVREELQGELGARITRNVRKLVRREVHRVLETRDFD